MILPGPDICDDHPSVIVCPPCLDAGSVQRTFYALNTDRYVCPVHGPILTAAMVPSQSGTA